MSKKSDWLLNGDLPRSHWEKSVADYQLNKTSSKKVKAQNEYKGPNKHGDLVNIRYTIDNGGNKRMRPARSSKAVLKELKRDNNRPKPILSEGEMLFLKDKAKAVSEYNTVKGYNHDNPKAAELDHIYGSRTPQHPAFIQPRERHVNQVKGGQAADAGFPKLNIYKTLIKEGKGISQLIFKALKNVNKSMPTSIPVGSGEMDEDLMTISERLQILPIEPYQQRTDDF